MILKLSFFLLDVATLLTQMEWLRLKNHVDTALQKEKGTNYFVLRIRNNGIKWVKHLRDDLSGVSSLVSFNKIAPEFHNFVRSYSEFRSEVDKVTDLAHVGEFICDLAADYENLCSSFKDLESRFIGSSARDEDDVAVKASDSVSQASLGRTSSSSKSFAARRIELECKRASLLAIRDLEKAKAKAN